jgi:hypothetical protein
MFKMDNWPASCIVQEARKKIGKKNQKKYILKKIVSVFLKNHHLLKGVPFFSQHPFKRCRFVQTDIN